MNPPPILEPPKDANILVQLLYLLNIFSDMLANPTTATGRFLLFPGNMKNPNNIMQPGDLVKYAIRYPNTVNEYKKFFEMWGFGKAQRKALIDISKQLLSPSDIVTLGWREGWDNSTIQSRLLRTGIHQADVQNFINARKVYPGIQDVIRFAVREVYTPNIRQTFQLDEDYPTDVSREAAKLGLPESEAKNYWAAHWELPSIGQGFEMFHRTVERSSDPNADNIPLPSGKTVQNTIGYQTLQQLLKAADVMPFWRDKLTNIAYQPLTRVDVRRMYRLGVLDVDEVYKSYLDGGYDPQNALKMTQFTIKYENQEFDDITRANIINAYKDGVIDKDQLIDLFDGIQLSTTAKQFWIAQADYEKTEVEVKTRIDDIIELYRLGDMRVEDVRLQLNEMDLPANYVDRTIEKVIREQAKKRQVPTKGDLIDWLKKNVIGEYEFYEKMSLLGYRDDDIYNYLTEIAIDIDTSSRKYLPIKTYQRWYASGIIDVYYFTDVLTEMKVSQYDIETYVMEVKKQNESTDQETV